MGTNYYLHRNCCSHCGRGDEELHIGKSSAGWCFSLHVTDELPSLEAWKALWEAPGSVIKDEYGDLISPEAMLRTITQRSIPPRKSDPFGQDTPEWYRQNHAERGPNNLARHQVDGRHCIGHGAETYDLITGEFS